MSRKRLILAILLVLLAVAMIWSYVSYPRPKTVSTLKYAPGARVQAEKRREPVVQRTAPRPAPRPADNLLRLDLLDREQPVFKGYHRNIFRPLFVDELKLMKQKAVVAMPTPPPVPKAAPVQPVVAEPPRRELARFTFLGFLKKDGHKTIFLAKDKDIILVREGDVIAGRYKAVSVTDQSLSLVVGGSGEEIVIPLVENRALGAVK
jgi:hypothetical protein